MKVHAHDEYIEWANCDDCNPYVKCGGCGKNMADEWDGDNDPICNECIIDHAENYYSQDGEN